jgi:hypothetical protein
MFFIDNREYKNTRLNKSVSNPQNVKNVMLFTKFLEDEYQITHVRMIFFKNNNDKNSYEISHIAINDQKRLILYYDQFTPIIVSDPYPVYYIRTLIKLKLNITKLYVIKLCEFGKTDILEYLKKTNQNFIQNFIQNQLEYILYRIIYECRTNVLDWLINNNLQIKDSNYTLDYIPYHHFYTKIYGWFIDNNLPLKYSMNAINYASSNGNVNILEWWKQSGLELKYSEHALDWASENNHIDVLNWWLNSKLSLKYTKDAMDYASNRGHINVLDWWFNSGLELKYSKIVLCNISYDNTFCVNHNNVIDWWEKSKLLLHL